MSTPVPIHHLAIRVFKTTALLPIDFKEIIFLGDLKLSYNLSRTE